MLHALLLILAFVPPPLQGHVNDFAHLLSPQTVERLNGDLTQFQKDHEYRIVLVTIPSLQGDSVENVTQSFADAWKVGQKGKDNGVIFLLALQERKTRLATGYGAEALLTDAQSGQILTQARPYLKAADYNKGFAVIAQGVMQALTVPVPAPASIPSPGPPSSLFWWVVGGILGITLGYFGWIFWQWRKDEEEDRKLRAEMAARNVTPNLSDLLERDSILTAVQGTQFRSSPSVYPPVGEETSSPSYSSSDSSSSSSSSSSSDDSPSSISGGGDFGGGGASGDF